MNYQTADVFFSDIEIYLKKYFKNYGIEFLIKTQKSLKINVRLDEELFIAIRYNARNMRTDFAVICKSNRIFGFDNLKDWHYHPFEEPDKHIFCDKPSLEKILLDVKDVCEKLNI